MTFHLTLADVKTKGLAAYHAKQLSAQGPTPACRYRDASGRPCIVGAALPDDVAATLRGSTPIGHIRSDVIEIDRGEQTQISDLQKIHDAWATLMGVSSYREETAGRLLEGVKNVGFTEVNPTNIEALLVERLS